MTLYLWVVLVVTSVFKVSSQCDHGEVRLVGGSGPHEGRVEVCIVSRWGRVCSFNWDANDATVVCRQLGYSPPGANTSEFGQGDGPMLLNNVLCDPNINKALLECKSAGISYSPCYHMHDAGVKCTDELRVKNITAHILNTSSTGSVHTALVTWEQNLTVDKPSSFKVECHNEQYSITTSVSNENSNTQLGGLLSSSYNCCVSAVYPLYEAKQICTVINTTSSTVIGTCTTSNITCTLTINGISSAATCNNQESNGTKSADVVIGVLGFFTAVLIILLTLSGIALLCLLRPELRKGLIPGRYSTTAAAMTHSTTSGTSTQVTRVTCGDESTAEYSSLVRETINSRRSDGRSRNQVLHSEKYRFTDMQDRAGSSNGVSTEGNVSPGQVIGHEDYARLQR